MTESNATSIFGDVIHSYTRTQAIEDGVLVDVTPVAREAGIKFPVALTRAVWDKYVVPGPRAKEYGQTKSGRLWDTLWMLRLAATRGGQVIHYRLYFIMKERRRLVTLKAVCGPGDEGEPVITVMLPEED